jgi:hypothetical protein
MYRRLLSKEEGFRGKEHVDTLKTLAKLAEIL